MSLLVSYCGVEVKNVGLASLDTVVRSLVRGAFGNGDDVSRVSFGSVAPIDYGFGLQSVGARGVVSCDGAGGEADGRERDATGRLFDAVGGTVDDNRGDGECCGAVQVDGDGGFVLKRGNHWKKNQKKKQQKKRRSSEGINGSDWRKRELEDKTVLQLSLEEKWAAENALKTAKAKRELELLGQQSVEEVAKLQQKKLQAALDKTMVQIEKSHATLASTGNVPGVVPQGGYCKTVLSEESVPVLSEGCTISPDSSASMHEYNLAMKKVAQLELENAQLKRGAKFDKYRYTGAVTLTCDSGGNLSDACEEDLKKNLRVGWMEASRETYVDEGAEDSTGKAMGVRVEQVPNMSYMPMRHFI